MKRATRSAASNKPTAKKTAAKMSAAKTPAAKKAAAKMSAAKTPAAKKAAAKKPAKTPAAKTSAAKKPTAAKAAGAKVRAAKSAAAKTPTAKSPATKAPAAKRDAASSSAPAKAFGQRADFGAPIAGFFAKQPAALRPILEQLRDLVQAEVPGAEASIKWGMPVFTLDGNMMCALRGNKAHVNLILSGTPSAFDDPDELLEGAGKTGKHLKLVPGGEIPPDVRGWIATAAQLARAK